MAGVESDNDEDRLLIVMEMLDSSICFLFAGVHKFVLSTEAQNCSLSASFVFNVVRPIPFILKACSRLILILDLCKSSVDFSFRYAIHVVERCVCTLEHFNSESTLIV